MVPFLGLELGYPDPTEAAGVKPRLPQHVVVHRERYDDAAAASGIDDYDRTLAEYYAGYGQDHRWSTQLLGRLHRDALTASERWRLREVFEDSGLTLR